MNLRQYLITMIFATTLCWVAWGFVVLNVDPFAANALSFVFFYVSFLLALIGTVSLVIFFVYRLFGSHEIPLFRYVQISFRQAFILSLSLIGLLYLQGRGLLNIWNALILITMFVLIISFTLSVRRSPQIHRHLERP